MSHTIRKQAVPIEFFEEICADEKLRSLIDLMWASASGMFSWFTTPPFVPGFGQFPSPIEMFKQSYRDGEVTDSIFESEDDLETYCSLLEQRLEELKTNNPLLVQRKVNLASTVYGQIYDCLLEELKVKFSNLNAEFASTAMWGGERTKPDSDLLYLSPEQVGAIAHVLNQIEVDEMLRHFDASPYSNDNYWIEECRETIQAFKTCFAEAAEQVILTKII